MTSLKFGKFVACLTVVFAFASQASAKCEVFYDRTACAGKDKESYAKCDGQKTCTRTVDAESEGECQDAAKKACANDRFEITKLKVIKAKWSGKDIKSKSGKDDFCEDYEKRDQEFNKCK